MTKDKDRVNETGFQQLTRVLNLVMIRPSSQLGVNNKHGSRAKLKLNS